MVLKSTSVAGIWGTSSNCNATYFVNETTLLYRLSLAACSLSETFLSCFNDTHNGFIKDRFVDGGCFGCPTRARFRGVIRNSTSVWIARLFGFISYSKDILHDELLSMHCGLSLTKNMGLLDLV